MKAKLIKEKDGRFHLWLNVGTKDADHIASNEPLVGEWGRNLLKYKLSLKNCQAIERGYDLDELAEETYPIFNLGLNATTALHTLHQESYKSGFQKALEILGDRKFSINEVVELCKILISNPFEKCGKTYQELTDNYIQSLQQNEWEVEVEMEEEKDFIFDSAMGIPQGHYLDKPKLDADGCLILKRV